MWLQNLALAKVAAAGLPIHLSVGWHWGHCSVSTGVVNYVDVVLPGGGGGNKSAAEHMLDIADSVDVQVGWNEGPQMVSRAETFGSRAGKQRWVLAYTNPNSDCRATFYPHTEACATGAASEAGMLAAFAEIRSATGSAGGIHYYGSAHSAGLPGWPTRSGDHHQCRLNATAAASAARVGNAQPVAWLAPCLQRDGDLEPCGHYFAPCSEAGSAGSALLWETYPDPRRTGSIMPMASTPLHGSDGQCVFRAKLFSALSSRKERLSLSTAAAAAAAAVVTAPISRHGSAGCRVDLWTDIAGGEVCLGECTVVAELTSHGSCNSYCAAQQGGLDCVGSWTDTGNTCTPASGNNGCDDAPNSSDDICKCAPPVAADDPRYPLDSLVYRSGGHFGDAAPTITVVDDWSQRSALGVRTLVPAGGRISISVEDGPRLEAVALDEDLLDVRTGTAHVQVRSATTTSPQVCSSTVLDSEHSVRVLVPADVDVLVSVLADEEIVYRCGSTHTGFVASARVSAVFATHPPLEQSSVSVNPGRGFYHTFGGTDLAAGSAPAWQPLELTDLLAKRLAGSTLVMRNYVLDPAEPTLSSEITTRLAGDLATVRDAGQRIILRFNYNKSPNRDSEGNIIPPYNDATLAVITEHIEQLALVVNEHTDVVAVLQTGFVGLWGEWAYSDHITTPELKNAVLAAIDLHFSETIRRAIRTPALANSFFSSQAGVSDRSELLGRFTQHNDCFLASDSDYGTFDNYDAETAAWHAETEHAVGGETCSPDANRGTCSVALDEMSRLHYSYLNADYNVEVLQSLAPCMPALTTQMGYALTASNVVARVGVADGKIHFGMTVLNDGFAPVPLNYNLQLVVLSVDASEVCEASIPSGLYSPTSDWRGHGRLHVIEPCVYSSVPAGASTIYLAMTDPSTVLRKRPEYRVLLRGTDATDHQRGLNGFHLDGDPTHWPESGGGACQIALSCGPASDFTNVLPMTRIPAVLRPTPAVALPRDVTLLDNLLKDASFEADPRGFFETEGVTVAGWRPFGEGFELTSDVADVRSGHIAARVTSTTSSGGAVKQDIDFAMNEEGVYPTSVEVTGCSKVTGQLTGTPGNGYSVYVDTLLADDAYMWGTTASFDSAETGFHCRSTFITNAVGIRRISLYGILRYATGTVVFDDFTATVAEPNCWGNTQYCKGVSACSVPAHS